MKLCKFAFIAAIGFGLPSSVAVADEPTVGLLEGPTALVSYCEQSTNGCSASCDTSCGSNCDGSPFRLRYGFDIGLGHGVKNFARKQSRALWDSARLRGLFDKPGVSPERRIYNPKCEDDWLFGGWLQIGWHDSGLSGNGPSRFNNNPDELNVQQFWLYYEKVADGSCGLDIGGRIDAVIGTDGPDTQSFGGNNNHWDNDWDLGPDYGVAIPQLYAELAYGPLSVKLGHFYTLIGYEVVQAPQNFFYSHAWTMVNSEPFTHTGFLASYQMTDALTFYGGYSFGWDTGFENNGDNFIGGVSMDINCNTTLTVTAALGRIDESTGESGSMYSGVLTRQLSDDLQYIVQIDWLDTNTRSVELRQTLGVNQYVLYDINDNWSAGARVEWWRAGGRFFQANDTDRSNLWDYTLGLNYRHNGNLTVRPEVRWTSDNSNVPLGVNENGQELQTTFAVDAILTF